MVIHPNFKPKSKVILVVMPFASVECPQIGVSTIKSQLTARGHHCDVVYLNLGFAEMVGYELYSWLTTYYNYSVFAGERTFARELFPQLIESDHEYALEILQQQGSFTPEQIQRIMQLTYLVKPFIDYCLTAVDWRLYSVIGFTSIFEQNTASLLLSKKIKQGYPDKTIVFGGGNCAGEMGVHLHQCFPWIDYVFTGEADFTFPELVDRLSKGNSKIDDIPGYVRRENNRSVATPNTGPLRDLDALPIPNYDDYFQQLKLSSFAQRIGVWLPVETSRGCWWGEKRHCTFCALAADQVAYRTKSAQRALSEIEYLTRRYRIEFLGMVDNILDNKFIKTMLPELKRRCPSVCLMYETKANLSSNQLKLLSDSGVVSIQPGIESLNDHQLRLMRKGVTALQNIQLLKWAQELGIDIHWNYLYGFPGERVEDYREACDLIGLLTHLQPPQNSGPMRLDRFSPYYECPEEFGIQILGAPPIYSYLYPFEKSVLGKLSFFFDYDFKDKEKHYSDALKLQHIVDNWKKNHVSSRLEIVSRTNNGITIWDRRPVRRNSLYHFGEIETAVIDYCDKARSITAIENYLNKKSKAPLPSIEWLEHFLRYLIDHRLMVSQKSCYLSIVVCRKANKTYM